MVLLIRQVKSYSPLFIVKQMNQGGEIGLLLGLKETAKMLYWLSQAWSMIVLVV